MFSGFFSSLNNWLSIKLNAFFVFLTNTPSLILSITWLENFNTILQTLVITFQLILAILSLFVLIGGKMEKIKSIFNKLFIKNKKDG